MIKVLIAAILLTLLLSLTLLLTSQQFAQAYNLNGKGGQA